MSAGWPTTMSVWELQALAPATVVGTVKSTQVDGAETVDTIGIENTSDVPACDVRSEILSGPQGGEVLPSFWTDNALTLMPHEKREVTVRYRTALLAGAEPHLMIEGFNVMPREINIADGKVVPLAIKLVGCESAPARNGKPTVKLTYVNAGTSGPRYTSWPIPLAVDGQVVRYAHVDVSGSEGNLANRFVCRPGGRRARGEGGLPRPRCDAGIREDHGDAFADPIRASTRQDAGVERDPRHGGQSFI